MATGTSGTGLTQNHLYRAGRHKQRQDRGADETANDHGGQGALHLAPGALTLR